MKNHYLPLAVLALALGLTACSPKSTETTAALTTAATEAPAATGDADEELEEDYFYGYVEAADGDTITVAADDGLKAQFNVSDAELSGAEAIGEGDEVEITFLGEMSDGIIDAEYVDIITSAAGEAEALAASEEDQAVSGTIEADDKTVTLVCEDGTYTFNALIAQKVTADGIKAGVEAEITYYGDLEDEEDKPVATRIVTEDAMDSEDAGIYALTGKVVEVSANHVVLDTVDPDNTLFAFFGEDGMFDSLSVGDTATVEYEGTLTDKSITAVGLK